jgi:hypothetical protein
MKAFGIQHLILFSRLAVPNRELSANEAHSQQGYCLALKMNFHRAYFLLDQNQPFEVVIELINLSSTSPVFHEACD